MSLHQRSAVAARADEIGLGQQRTASRSVVDQIVAQRGIVSIPAGQLLANPRNVREDMGDIPGLGASIREHGIVQTLIACSREAYEAAGGPTILDPAVTHVTLDGARRVVAGGLAQVDAFPAIVRDDLVGVPDFELQLITSLHRKGLTPLEEARAIEQIPGRQVDVAARIGCSQPTVSRRLKLLRLPEIVKAGLRDEFVTLADVDTLCRELLDEPDLLLQAYGLMTRAHDVRLSATSAVDQVRIEQTHGRNAIESALRLTQDDVRPVDPAAEWGSQAKRHLIGHDELSKAMQRTHRGCLAGAVSPEDGLVDWYCADLSRHGLMDDVAESRAARGHRSAALTAVANDWPGASAAGYDLAECVLADARPGTALGMAIGWATSEQQGFVRPEVAAMEQPAALDWIRTQLPRDARVRFARLLTLAAGEVAVRKTGEWGPRQAAYLELLADKASYVTTPWERYRLDAHTEEEVLGR